MVLYIAVTRDKYELPIAVADSASELARMLGVKSGTVYRSINKVDEGISKKSMYHRVVVEEDNEMEEHNE